MSNNFFSAMYPNLGKLSDGALNTARVVTSNKLHLPADHPAFKCGFSKADFIESMAMIILEEELRWENGGKQKFDAMLKRTFG